MTKKQSQKSMPNWSLSGHTQPKTRREFLAHGLIPFVASTFLPNPFNLIKNFSLLDSAYGNTKNCNSSSGTHSWIPVVQIDLAGGAALMANFIPKDQGGQMLPSHNRMGLGKTPSVASHFGGASFYTQSGILAGITAQATEAIRNRTSMFGVCVQSADDRNSNLMAINGVLQKLGVNGSSMPHTGNVNSSTAGHHQPALMSVEGPLVVSNFTTLTSALNFTGSLNSLSSNQKEKLVKLTEVLNSSQSQVLAEQAQTALLHEITSCAAQKTTEVVTTGSSLVDPRPNTDFQRIWGINANTPTNNQSLIFAGLVFNTLKKQSGSCTIQLGGYDYHGQTRAASDQRDNDAGQLIGRVLSSAQALNTPVFIIVTSDGSVGSAQSDTAGGGFTSDRGPAGVLYSFIFDPQKQHRLKANQLGHFETGQLASENSLVGGSTERAMAGILINYLALHNRVGDLEKVLGQRLFSTEELDRLILIDS
jgi:hypothetical protein